jgi:hypothetical protein
MTDIASVIGWKFNHQQGMRTKGGVITEFPGGIPSQADQDLWTAEYEAHLLAGAYIPLRQASIADGGYGTIPEQLEMIGEQGIGVFQAHIASVKGAIRKPV